MKELKRSTFTNGFVSLLELNDGKQIEATATCLPMSTEMRGTDRTDNYAVDYNQHDVNNWQEKVMIGVSTQSGCPIKCKFCAVNDLTARQGWRNLSTQEICDQVSWAILSVHDKYKVYTPDAKLFRVLFTRMGEPAMNSRNVIAAAKAIKTTYPNVRIQISTIGFGRHTDALVMGLAALQADFGEQFIELQFSVHSTSHEYRQWLQHNGVSTNAYIQNLIERYHRRLETGGVEIKWKVTLNFALTEQTPFDIVSLKEQFDPEDVFIKVSPINENKETEKNNIKGVILQTNEV
ncbi:hypothetical protein [Pectobacterium phage Wc4-1]|uniref:Radical SAM core domain-containing protein n=1 Tax=Pectobacterium phage Wc4 TaxID=2652428 RepID=A0A5P8D478_9CAUD|nr:hypothetical protein [Pectobacterium phage Wc4]QFP94031.1 hypothetical protein [Pectobacterium phage Wc4-1]